MLYILHVQEAKNFNLLKDKKLMLFDNQTFCVKIFALVRRYTLCFTTTAPEIENFNPIIKWIIDKNQAPGCIIQIVFFACYISIYIKKFKKSGYFFTYPYSNGATLILEYKKIMPISMLVIENVGWQCLVYWKWSKEWAFISSFHEECRIFEYK